MRKCSMQAPKPSTSHMAHGRPGEQGPPVLVADGGLDFTGRQAPAVHLDGQILERFCALVEFGGRRERNGSSSPRTCGTSYSTSPSAVFNPRVR